MLLEFKLLDNMKQDILNYHLKYRYGGIETIMADDKYSEQDFKDFLNFCDWQYKAGRPQYADLSTFIMVNELKDKIRTKGIDSVLYREDVLGTNAGAEQDERGNITKFVSVNTKYGKILVGKGNRIMNMII